MKLIKLLLIVIFLMLLVSCKSGENYVYSLSEEVAGAVSSEMSVEYVTEGVVLVNHRFPWEANSMVIEMKNSDIVLIDTPYTYGATKLLVDWIKNQVGAERTIVAVNTGYHFDNLGGNGYLVENGIEVIGTRQTVDLIHQRGELSREWFLENLKAPQNEKYFDVFEDQEYVEPSEIISIEKDQEIILNFGAESIRLYYPGESHAPDNLVVYYPDKKVLFGGCMVKELKATDLGNVSEANLLEWATSISKLKSKYTGELVTYLIPGHGHWGGIELLDQTSEMLNGSLF